MQRKPLVTARERSIVEPNPEQDAFYMPGYSDKRRERELAIRDGHKPRGINGRLHAVVTQDLQGKPVKLKEREFRMKGYVPLTIEQAQRLGYDIKNSGYEVRPDGTVGMNEYTLFYASPDVAEREIQRVESKNEAMQEAAQAKMEDAAANFNAALGLQGRGATTPLFEEDKE